MTINPKLDLKDRKILYALDINARQPDLKIAKKVGLSQQAVNYRIRNLVRRGIIREFYTVINIAKLGYTYYKVYFKLQNITPEKEREIIDFLVNHNNLIWIGTCSGRWDISVSILAKNIIQFNRIVRAITNEFSEYIQSKDILTVSELPHFTRAYLLEKESNIELIEFSSEPEETRLDETDKKIISRIAVNAGFSYPELARDLNLSADIIRYRIKKLQEDKIIQGYRAWIDLDLIGYQFYKVLLSLQNVNEKREKTLLNFCSQHPNIVYILKTIGSWDMELEFEVRDIKEFNNAMMELRNKFQDIIRNYEPLLIFREHKINYYPGLEENTHPDAEKTKPTNSHA